MEKRKAHRSNLYYYLKVCVRETNTPFGHLVDITPEGIMIVSEKPIPTGTVYDLQMEFPKEILGEKRLDFSARSMWCRKDMNPDYFDTGFQFLDVPLDKVLLIKKLVMEYGFIY